MLSQPPLHLKRSQLNQHVVSALNYTQHSSGITVSLCTMQHIPLCGLCVWLETLCPVSLYIRRLKMKHEGWLSVWLLLYTISTFFFLQALYSLKARVSTGCLCTALVLLPAGSMARWVSDGVVGAWRAPSVLCEGPLMGPKLQRPEI